MLNPYVPGNAGATSATSKKKKPAPTDLIDGPVDYMNERGQPLPSEPTSSDTFKPAVKPSIQTQLAGKPTGDPQNDMSFAEGVGRGPMPSEGDGMVYTTDRPSWEHTGETEEQWRARTGSPAGLRFPLPGGGGGVGHAAIINGRHWDGRPAYEGTPRMPEPQPQVTTPMPRPNTGIQPQLPVQPPSQSFTPTTGTAGVNGVTGGVAGGTGLGNIPQYQFAEDRLTDMISGNSAYMQRARREGLNAAAARGGVNSSIAGGFALGAAIDRAAPIATADAQFTQEDYLTGRRALLDDIRSGNDSGRRMTEQTNQGNINDSLNANENVREMGRTNLEADLTNQRDRNLSTLRRNEMQFETELSDQLRNNDTQREAWLGQQSDLSSAYATALLDSSRMNMGFLDQLGAAMLADPEVYSPEVVAGMNSFFSSLSTNTSNNALSQILRSMMATGGVRPPGP